MIHKRQFHRESAKDSRARLPRKSVLSAALLLGAAGMDASANSDVSIAVLGSANNPADCVKCHQAGGRYSYSNLIADVKTAADAAGGQGGIDYNTNPPSGPTIDAMKAYFTPATPTPTPQPTATPTPVPTATPTPKPTATPTPVPTATPTPKPTATPTPIPTATPTPRPTATPTPIPTATPTPRPTATPTPIPSATPTPKPTATPTPIPTATPTPKPTATPTPRPTATPTPRPTPTPPPGNASCNVNYQIYGQWGDGFVAGVVLRNTGATEINGWKAIWDMPNGQRITQLWNGQLTQTQAHVEVTNASWNGKIPAGQAIQFGFTGTHSGTNGIPTALTVNGQACSGLPGGTIPTPTPKPTATPTPLPTPKPTPVPGQNAAPVLDSVPASFTAQAGQELRFTVTAADANDDAIRIKASGLPRGARLTQGFDTTLMKWAAVVTWTPSGDSDDSYKVTFQAVEMETAQHLRSEKRSTTIRVSGESEGDDN